MTILQRILAVLKRLFKDTEEPTDPDEELLFIMLMEEEEQANEDIN